MTPIGIESLSAKVPAEYLISQNYPNPFNPATNIKFEIPNAGPIRLSVFDALGREVAKLVDQNMDAGSYKADWNASGYPSGVYFYRLQSSGISITKKMVLAK
jgi:hypothetical protein